MIRTVTLQLDKRRIDFSLLLDGAFMSDQAIDYYLAHGSPPEPEVCYLMARTVQEGMTVVDAGANVGFFTVLLSRLVGPSGRVIAIEPAAENAAKLRENLALNRIVNVKLHRNILAAKAGRGWLYQHIDNGQHSCGGADTIQRTEVEAVTLDAICADELPALIKMDIEGSEYEALRGAENLLGRQPPFVVMELNKQALAKMFSCITDIRDWMTQFEYDMFLLHENGSLPTLVPDKVAVEPQRQNVNVLFSTVENVAKLWPEIAV